MSSIIIKKGEWSWKNMTLSEYIHEGNYPRLCNKWANFFEKHIELLENISDKLEDEKDEKDNYVIYPEINHVFRAFIPCGKISVVIIGQDPYHNGSAVGLCFSVKGGNKLNPSVKNIYQELTNEGYTIDMTGNLTHWACQGCFMLNTALTVPKGLPEEHLYIWHEFTKETISFVVKNSKNLIWLLMGSKAAVFHDLIKSSENEHEILITSHPSPYSANKKFREFPAFLGSNIFKKTNELLGKFGKKQIKW